MTSNTMINNATFTNDTSSPTDAMTDRVRQQFFNTQPCRFFQRGRCRRGFTCTFAHGDVESRPDLCKTSLCKNWLEGLCKYSNSKCTFAHGCDDLRRTPLFESEEKSEVEATISARNTAPRFNVSKKQAPPLKTHKIKAPEGDNAYHQDLKKIQMLTSLTMKQLSKQRVSQPGTYQALESLPRKINSPPYDQDCNDVISGSLENSGFPSYGDKVIQNDEGLTSGLVCEAEDNLPGYGRWARQMVQPMKVNEQAYINMKVNEKAYINSPEANSPKQGRWDLGLVEPMMVTPEYSATSLSGTEALSDIIRDLELHLASEFSLLHMDFNSSGLRRFEDIFSGGIELSL